VGTALLHSAIVLEKRNTLKSWTILLAILTFALSLLGTFLVRSGVLTSVHAFASDPGRGVFILMLLLIAVGGSLTLFALRAPAMQSGSLFAPISREGALLLNNLLLSTATVTVLLGTLYPLALEALGGAKISVGPPYFNATFVPLMIPLLLAVPIGAMMSWKRGDLPGVMGRLKVAAGASLVVALGYLAFFDLRGVLAALGFALAAWLVVGSLVELAGRIALFRIPLARSFNRFMGLPRSALGMTVAHMGLGILIVGITATSSGQVERILVMRPGETADLAGYEVTFKGVSERQGPNFVAERATFEARRNGELETVLHSERRFFPVEQQTTTEAGIDTTLWRDLYFVLGDKAGEDGARTVRLYFNPLVVWLWGGAVIMALGGFISLSDRRLRVGAPVPAAARAGLAKA